AGPRRGRPPRTPAALRRAGSARPRRARGGPRSRPRRAGESSSAHSTWRILSPVAGVLFGTASFAYEGWKGIVYHDRYREATFKVECLREYARYAPFRTVEFDFPFYRPPTEAQLSRYERALPACFLVGSEVWA